ncbi:MAG: hypothetical protein K0S21_3648 [Rhizobiaceae bacterium]|nr:hypothetical protein [Rhizobiaceae bacterium]
MAWFASLSTSIRARIRSASPAPAALTVSGSVSNYGLFEIAGLDGHLHASDGLGNPRSLHGADRPHRHQRFGAGKQPLEEACILGRRIGGGDHRSGCCLGLFENVGPCGNAGFGVAAERGNFLGVGRDRGECLDLRLEGHAALNCRFQRRRGDGERDFRLRRLCIDFGAQRRDTLLDGPQPSVRRGSGFAGRLHHRLEPGDPLVERSQRLRGRPRSCRKTGDRRFHFAEALIERRKSGIVAAGRTVRFLQRRQVAPELLDGAGESVDTPGHLRIGRAVSRPLPEFGNFGFQRGDFRCDAIRPGSRVAARRPEQAGELQQSATGQRHQPTEKSCRKHAYAAARRCATGGRRGGRFRCRLPLRPFVRIRVGARLTPFDIGGGRGVFCVGPRLRCSRLRVG